MYMYNISMIKSLRLYYYYLNMQQHQVNVMGVAIVMPTLMNSVCVIPPTMVPNVNAVLMVFMDNQCK